MPAAHDAGALLLRGVVLEASALRWLVGMPPSQPQPFSILRQVASLLVSDLDRVFNRNTLADRFEDHNLVFDLGGTLDGN